MSRFDPGTVTILPPLPYDGDETGLRAGTCGLHGSGRGGLLSARGTGEQNSRRMEPTSVQLAAAFALTSLVGALMLVKGFSAHLLERRTVRCRTCGGPHSTGSCHRD